MATLLSFGSDTRSFLERIVLRMPQHFLSSLRRRALNCAADIALDFILPTSYAHLKRLAFRVNFQTCTLELWNPPAVPPTTRFHDSHEAVAYLPNSGDKSFHKSAYPVISAPSKRRLQTVLKKLLQNAVEAS